MCLCQHQLACSMPVQVVADCLVCADQHCFVLVLRWREWSGTARRPAASGRCQRRCGRSRRRRSGCCAAWTCAATRSGCPPSSRRWPSSACAAGRAPASSPAAAPLCPSPTMCAIVLHAFVNIIRNLARGSFYDSVEQFEPYCFLFASTVVRSSEQHAACEGALCDHLAFLKQHVTGICR